MNLPFMKTLRSDRCERGPFSDTLTCLLCAAPLPPIWNVLYAASTPMERGNVPSTPMTIPATRGGVKDQLLPSSMPIVLACRMPGHALSLAAQRLAHEIHLIARTVDPGGVLLRRILHLDQATDLPGHALGAGAQPRALFRRAAPHARLDHLAWLRARTGQPVGLGHRPVIDLAQPGEQHLALLLGDIAAWMDVGEKPASHVVIDEWLGAHGLAPAVRADGHVERSSQQAVQQLRLKCNVHRLIHCDRERFAAGACERHFGGAWH